MQVAMWKKLGLISLAIAATFATTSPTPTAFAADDKIDNSLNQSVGDKGAKIDWSNGLIIVTGSGVAPDRAASPAQKRLLATRAAQVDAYRQLAEIINGVHVDSETTVKDFVTESDVIKTKVEALVKGARRLGNPRYTSDGAVEVDLVADMFGKSGLFSVIEPQKQSSPPPEPKVSPKPVNESYTGVVIDCRGLGMEPAMSPAILDEQKGEIYLGRETIDADFVLEEGIVAYVKTLDDAKKLDRIGANPLVIKGKAKSGGFNADVILNNADASAVLGAEAKDHLLDKSRVAFLM